MPSILILGARSDIAKALARRFAADGFDCVFAARDEGSLDALVADISLRTAIEARAVAFDALDESSHPDWVAALDPLPDVTACVFGYLGDPDQARHDPAEAATILRTNFNGAVSILDRIADRYEAQGTGTIIGVSSVAGDRGRQSNYHYGSAKAGLNAYLAGLRNRLAPSGVHVLTVKPGFVDTKMTEGLDLPPLITGQPDKVAADIFRAFRKKKDVLYTLWMWRYIMLIVRSIPEKIFKKMKM